MNSVLRSGLHALTAAILGDDDYGQGISDDCCGLVCLLLHLLPRSVVVSLGEVWTPSPSPAPVSGQKLGLDFTIRLPPGGGRRKRQARAEYRGVAQTRVQLQTSHTHLMLNLICHIISQVSHPRPG